VWDLLCVKLPADEPVDHGEPVAPAVDRRTLDEVFGEVLPETTGDERSPERAPGEVPDDWYLENRPPHHDR